MEGKTTVFTKGMHGDNDPRYQPEGTYRDATNIKLVSEEGSTYTVENISGTRFVLDLGCADEVYVFNVNITGTNKYVVGDTYQWKLHYVDHTGYTSSSISTSTLSAYVYSDQQNLANDIAASINALNDGTTGDKLFNAYTNSTQVVVEVISAGAGWSQIVGISATNASNLTYGTSNLSNGFSHTPSGGSVSHTATTSVIANPLQLSRRNNRLCNLTIVGHYSFGTELYLYTYDYITATDNGQIWKIEFYNDGTVKSQNVVYNNALTFSKSRKLIVEGIVENDCITRLYWTDNHKPIRSINLTDPNAFAFKLNDLLMSPLTDMDRPVLKNVTNGGTLEVGMYQVGYKLISQGGSKSNLSPMSNLIPVTLGNSEDFNDVNSGDPSSGQANAGEISSKAFSVEVNNIDTDFDSVEFYILVYEVFGSAPTKILQSSAYSVSLPVFEYTHSSNALKQITPQEFLIQSNTFDTAKDIAVKDQRLFAANLRSIAIDISSFDTEVYRWKAEDVADTLNTSSFTTGCDFVNNNGMDNGSGGLTAWTNSNTGSGVTLANGKKTRESGVFVENETDYKYLPIALENSGLHRNGGSMTSQGYRSLLLGAQTRYFDSTKGGVRITFQTQERIIDTQKNYGWYRANRGPDRDTQFGGTMIRVNSHAVIDAGRRFQSTQTPTISVGDDVNLVKKNQSVTQGTSIIDNHSENEDTFYQNIDYDTNENPYVSYDSRGYFRGETYRFGITFFDKNHKEIRTKFIGDIKMPEHWEQQYRFKDDTDTSIEYNGDQGVGFPGMELYDLRNAILDQNIYCEDFRISYIKGLRNPYNDYKDFKHGTHHTVGNIQTRPDIFPYYTPQGAANYSGGVVQGHLNNEIGLSAAFDQGGALGYAYPDDYGAFAPNGDRTFGNPDFNHYVQDLHLRFEVIIPEDLKDVIGAYKIVRVKREEKDKTIVGQGILSQCVFHRDWGASGGWIPGRGLLHTFQQEEWALDLHEKYAPFVNPLFFMFNANVTNSVDNQPALGVGPSHTNTLAKSQNIKQGQLNNYSGLQLVGYNKYFTWDCPDIAHMSKGYTHTSGSKIDVISVLKNVDSARRKTFNKTGNTELGSIWNDNQSWIDTYNANSSIFHGRKWMNRSNLGHNSWSDRIESGGHEVYYTKFVVYDTRSFKFPQSIINLKNNVGSTVNTTTTLSGGTANGYWQNNLTIKSSKKIGFGEKGIIGGVEFSNRGTDYHLQYKGPGPGTPNNQGFSTVYYSSQYGESLQAEGRESSVGKMCETVFLVLEDGAEKILSVPDIDRAYLNGNDTPTYGQGENMNGNDENLKASSARIPYALLANIKKVVTNQYGGNSDSNLLVNRFIDTGHFTYVGDNIEGVQTSKVSGGDTFIQFYAKEKYTGGKIEGNQIIPNDEDYFKRLAGNCTEWYFPVETFVNTSLVHGSKKLREELYKNYDSSTAGDAYNTWVAYGKEDDDYNEVYSQEPDLKGYYITDEEECEIVHLPHQIAFSNVKLSGEPKKDAWKNFNIFDFHDVDGVHGPINNLFVLNDFMYYLQSYGVGVLDINPRTMITTTEGSQIHAGTGDTIQDHRYVTTKYGCQHQHSLITGTNHAYWVDALNSKIFQFDGKSINPISDTLGQRKFLKDILSQVNLSNPVGSLPNIIKTTDTPLEFIGIHGGYNKSKGDVIFTFFDATQIRVGQYANWNKETIVFNDKIESFVTRLTVHPNLWIPHMDSIYSTNNYQFGFTETAQDSFLQSNLYEWESLDVNNFGYPYKTVFYDFNLPVPSTLQHINGFTLEAVINEHPQLSKIFDNLGVVMTMQNWQNFGTSTIMSKTGIELIQNSTTVATNFLNGRSATFNEIELSTELSDFANMGTHKIFNSVTQTNMDERVIYREGVLHLPTRAAFTSTEGTASSLGRLRGTYMKIKFTANDTTNKFNIFALRPYFRKSYK